MSLRDSGHASVFLVAAYALVRIIYGNRRLTSGQIVAVLILTLCIGIGIEMIQPHFGREASGGDVVNDFLGIIAAIIIHQAIRSGYANSKEVKLILLALLIWSLSLTVPLHYLWLYHKKDTLFPTLLDFESSWQSESLTLNQGTTLNIIKAPNIWHDNHSMVGYIQISKGAFPGVAIVEPNANWTPFSDLTFEVYSTVPNPITILVRVHDRQHNSEFSDRFNTRLTMQPGYNLFNIPLEHIKNGPASRKIDLSSIAGLTIFFVSPRDPLEFYLDNLRLE